MAYVNFEEEIFVANIQLNKRKENNRKLNEVLQENKSNLFNYEPYGQYSFKITKDMLIGKEGILNERDFYELSNKDILVAQFIRCNFRNVKFNKCKFIGCYFEGCSFDGGGVIFQECIFIKKETDSLPALNKKDNLSCYFNNCNLYCDFREGRGNLLIFQNCILNNSNFEDIDLTSMIIKDCEINRVVMKDVNLSGAKVVNSYMEDFSFEDNEKSKFDEKTFFDKVQHRKKNRGEYEGLYKYYEDLADKFLANNLRNNYGEYYYLCNREKRKTIGVFQKIVYDLYFITCGYGERPWYALITSLALVIVFAFLFLIAGLEFQGEILKYSINYFNTKGVIDIIKDYNKVLSISFSIFGGVGMEHTLINQWGYIIENIEVISSVIMVTIGAGALTRKIVR